MRLRSGISVFILALLAIAAGCARGNKTATTASGQVVTGDKAAAIDRLRDSGADLQQLMNAPDAAVPDEVLKAAKCVAVVPDMVKGGFVIGAQHGRGVATCRTGNGWSAPAFFALTGGTWGAQIGVESIDLVMLVMNDQGMQHLLNSEFKLGAEGGVAAGPIGREAQASTDWKLKSEILTYSRARGVFAGLNLSGASIKQDSDATRAFYGSDIPFKTLLSGGERVTADARPFVASVQQAFHEDNVPANP